MEQPTLTLPIAEIIICPLCQQQGIFSWYEQHAKDHDIAEMLYDILALSRR